MAIYYSFFHYKELDKLDDILRLASTKDVGIVPVLPFYTNGFQVDFRRPLLNIKEWIHVLYEMRKHGVARYGVKFHLHPMDLEGLSPEWWPGYLWFSKRAQQHLVNVFVTRVFPSLANAAKLILGYPPDFVILGAEFDALAANVVNFKRAIKNVKKYLPETTVTYGTNVWQPLRWKYRWPIFWAHLLGRDEEVLEAILTEINKVKNSRTIEVASEKIPYLTDLLYKSYLSKFFFWRKFDAMGISTYWIPTMMDVDVEKAYRNYTFSVEDLQITIDFLDLLRQWSSGHKLIVTETGVLYDTPIARNAEKVYDWYRTTISFLSLTAEHVVLWNDTLHPILENVL